MTSKHETAALKRGPLAPGEVIVLRDHRGRPLGMLLGAVRPEKFTAGDIIALTEPFAVARRATITPKKTGTLYLKINDSAAELGDNAGELSVTVAPQ